MDFVIATFVNAWDVLVESAPYMALGLVVAGLLKGFLPDDMAARLLGRGRKREVALAAVIGAPLPL